MQQVQQDNADRHFTKSQAESEKCLTKSEILDRCRELVRLEVDDVTAEASVHSNSDESCIDNCATLISVNIRSKMSPSRTSLSSRPASLP
jgi:NADH:ubiquinone oxidoreductase subunit E